MRSILFRIAYALMGILACAWPLGVYQHIPLTGQTIVSIVGASLVFLWLLDLAVYRIARIPFELLWPTALITAIAIATRSQHTLQITAIAALFLAALHFARQRKDIEHWITWTAVSCLIAAIADLLYRAGYGWPTAYAIPSDLSESVRVLDAASAMSGSLTNSSVTLLAGTMLWAIIAYRTKTLPAIACFLVMIAAFGLHIAGLLSHIPTQPADWISGPPVRWMIGGLAVWLLARILAKVLVERSRTPKGQYLFIVAPVIAIALVVCFSNIDAMAWHAWATAIAAGYVIRDKRKAPAVSRKRFSTYAAIALITCVAINAYYIDETNAYDGRNYVQDLRADYAAGDLARAVERMEFWNLRTGSSPALDFWASLVALDLNRPDAAAAWSSGMADPTGTRRSLKPAPTQSEISLLLNRFRDHVSASPENDRRWAYERALSAYGDPTSAEASLRQRIASANPVYEEIDHAPLQHAAEFLLGDADARIDFGDWSVAELIAVLNLSGARIEPAPDEIDRSGLPAAIAVRRDAHGITVQVESGVSLRQTYSDAAISLNTPPAEFAETPWQIVALPFDASWQITLHTHDENAPPIATVTLGEDGDASVLLSDPLPDSLPDHSAVFIWLP